jgi:hypothetical protein
MTLKNISLALARTPEQPNGDPSHGYEFRAPLDADGRLDMAAWKDVKSLCTVQRIDHGIAAERGLLVVSGRGHWAFSYEIGDDDDEGIFKLTGHRIVPGEYITVTEHDDRARTFLVTDVRDWHPAGVAAHAAAY